MDVLKNNIKDNPIYRMSMFGMEISGKYYSKYRAFVIDNEDELNLNRLKLIIPTISDSQGEDIWAFPCNQWGGKDYGLNLLPQIGDMVWVEFEFGDANHPIWSHAGYAIEEKPEEFSSPNIYGFKTPLGTKIIINDDEGTEEVLIKLGSNNDWIKINKDTLELESKLIKLGQEGKENAILGNTLKEKLDSLAEEVKKLTDQLHSHTHAGPTGPPINKILIQNIGNSVNQLKETFPEILSKKVKID